MSKPIYAKFLNRNGYESEREKAAKVFHPSKKYKIIGGYIGGSHSSFQFEGIEGSWNTVMFDTYWEDAQHLMEHCSGNINS